MDRKIGAITRASVIGGRSGGSRLAIKRRPCDLVTLHRVESKSFPILREINEIVRGEEQPSHGLVHLVYSCISSEIRD